MDNLNQRIHGSFSFYLDDQLVAIRAFGSWNLECAQEFRKLVEKNTYLYHEKQYLSLIDLREWELGTPDAIAFLAEQGGKPQPYDRSIGGLREIELGKPGSYALKTSEKHIVGQKEGIRYLTSVEGVLEILDDLGVQYNKDRLRDFLGQQNE